MRKLLVVLLGTAVLLAALVGGAWILAGRSAGPAIDILQPVGTVGAAGRLDVAVEAPGGQLAALDVSFEQDGRETRLFSLASPGTAALQQETPERVRITRTLGQKDVPDLRAGAARVIVRAARPVLFGLRLAETTAARDLQVRLEPPRVTVVSTHHYVNHGGAEFVVYRVTPTEAASGVQVGDVEFPGYPAAGVHVDGVSLGDPSLKVAFFALLFDQDLDTPIQVFARDEAGNAARVPLESREFPTAFGRSRVELTDRFLARVVPPVLARTPDLGVSGDDPLAAFLAINGELRRRNADAIARLAAKTSPEMLWRGPFQQLGRSKVESRFADHRTYYYQGKEVDRQVHLGFDLASTANVPVHASNRGTVVHAGDLGIYGETVVLDHGMGVQSLYAHLSSITVRAGDMVDAGQTLGRTGQTGLAGGDHLHFTMLVSGRMVSPVEWWDPHWIEDRIVRKLREAR
jgi:murein DD-endopeptidase MepM/ murein hydrolase activator NlpD